MDVNQIWYYTFSTTAQVAGAILALGAAFVVYKLQHLSVGIGNYKGRIQKFFLPM